jgi:hypothetical protein
MILFMIILTNLCFIPAVLLVDNVVFREDRQLNTLGSFVLLSGPAQVLFSLYW